METRAHSVNQETPACHTTDVASETTRGNQPVESGKPRQWEVMAFKWIDKRRLPKWMKRKKLSVKLTSDASEEGRSISYTPDAVRRSSERVLRRAKMRLRQSSRSSSKSLSLSQKGTTAHVDFDFDDGELQGEAQNLETDSKEVDHDCNVCSLKEQSQDYTLSSLVVNDVFENSAVNSDKHPATFCTQENQDVHKKLHGLVSVVCEESTLDILCDEEVCNILEDVCAQEQSICKFPREAKEGNGDEINVQGDDPRHSKTDLHDVSGVGIGTGLPVTELQPWSNLYSQGNEVDSCLTECSNEIVKGLTEEPTEQQTSVSNDGSLSEEQATRNDGLLVDESAKDSSNQSNDDGVILAKDALEILPINSEESVAHNSTMGENCRVKERLSVSETLDDQKVSKLDTEEAKEDSDLSVSVEQSSKDFPSTKEAISNCVDPESTFGNFKKGKSNEGASEHQFELISQSADDADSNQASTEAHLIVNKGGEAKTAITNGDPTEGSSVLSSDQLNRCLPTSTNYPAGNSFVHVESRHKCPPGSPLGSPIAGLLALQSPPGSPRVIYPVVTQSGPFPVVPSPSSSQLPNVAFPPRSSQAAAVVLSGSLAEISSTLSDICPPCSDVEHRSLSNKSPCSLPSTLAQPAPTLHDNYHTEGVGLNPPQVTPSTSACAYVGSSGTMGTRPHPSRPFLVSRSGNALENAGSNQAQDNAMDQSTVNAVMQSYSEIREVERSENKNEKGKIDTDGEAFENFPNSPELTKVAGCKDSELSDVGMESDIDGSHISDIDVSEMEEVNYDLSEAVHVACIEAQEESTGTQVTECTTLENRTILTQDTVSSALDPIVISVGATDPRACLRLSPVVDAVAKQNAAVHEDQSVAPASMERYPEGHVTTRHVRPITLNVLPVESPSLESPIVASPLSPADPVFLSCVENTISSSIGDLSNLLGKSSSFDRIAEEVINSTVHSLEDVLRQAQNHYEELSNCPSDSGISAEEEPCFPSSLLQRAPIPTSPVQVPANKWHGVVTAGTIDQTSGKGSDQSMFLYLPIFYSFSSFPVF